MSATAAGWQCAECGAWIVGAGPFLAHMRGHEGVLRVGTDRIREARPHVWQLQQAASALSSMWADVRRSARGAVAASDSDMVYMGVVLGMALAIEGPEWLQAAWLELRDMERAAGYTDDDHDSLTALPRLFARLSIHGGA